MSATQIVLVGLVAIAFALGWIARGRRDALEAGAAPTTQPADEIDGALAAALTAFQAALATWQFEGRTNSQLTARVLATFAQRRAIVAGLTLDAGAPDWRKAGLARANAALERLAQGLAAYDADAVLDSEHERALTQAERALAAARSELLRGAARLSTR